MNDSVPATDCPCGTGHALDQCCGPFIRGEASPPTAEATMRSRYSAFALDNVDYVLSSHHSHTRDQADPVEVARWARESDWLGLEIDETEAGGEDDEEGTVTFHARYRLDGQLVNHREVAHFQREDGAWRFYSAHEPGAEEQPDLVPVVASSGIGRNDPCPCGSGSKYKKCHGSAA